MMTRKPIGTEFAAYALYRAKTDIKAGQVVYIKNGEVMGVNPADIVMPPVNADEIRQLLSLLSDVVRDDVERGIEVDSAGWCDLAEFEPGNQSIDWLMEVRFISRRSLQNPETGERFDFEYRITYSGMTFLNPSLP